MHVPPIKGGVIVNIADCLMRWSNDVLRSTPHCVMDDPSAGDADVPARYSIAFFCNPNKDTLVECLPTCSTADNPPKYGPITSFDYLVSRLNSIVVE